MTDAEIQEVNRKAAEMVMGYKVRHFNPMSRIDHAWMLVEKMREMGIGTHQMFGIYLRQSYELSVIDTRTPLALWLTPTAITLAAIQAVEKG